MMAHTDFAWEVKPLVLEEDDDGDDLLGDEEEMGEDEDGLGDEEEMGEDEDGLGDKEENA